MVPAVGGLVLGYSAVTLVVAAGLGAVVARSPAILTGLTIVGGAYLMRHGVMTFWHPATPSTDTEAGSRSSWNILRAEAGVSGLNPKGLLIFLALLPQFANPHASWPFALQIGVLGLAFTLTCAAFYTCLGPVRTHHPARPPTTARAVSRFSGAAMVIIDALLIAERLAN